MSNSTKLIVILFTLVLLGGVGVWLFLGDKNFNANLATSTNHLSVPKSTSNDNSDVGIGRDLATVSYQFVKMVAASNALEAAVNSND